MTTETDVRDMPVAEPAPMPKDTPKTGRDAARVFASNISPQIMFAMAFPATVARIWMGEWSLNDLWMTLAIIAWWPFNEWVIHVFMLHYKPRKIFGRTIDFRLPQTPPGPHGKPWYLPRGVIPTPTFPPPAPPPALIGLSAPATAPTPPLPPLHL